MRRRERIVIIGGGMAALTTAFELTILRRAGVIDVLGLEVRGDGEHATARALAAFYTEMDFTLRAADRVWAA